MARPVISPSRKRPLSAGEELLDDERSATLPGVVKAGLQAVLASSIPLPTLQGSWLSRESARLDPERGIGSTSFTDWPALAIALDHAKLRTGRVVMSAEGARTRASSSREKSGR